MLEAQSQARLDVDNAVAERAEHLAYVEEEFRRLKSFLAKGCILLREELRPGEVRWASASRSGKSFHTDAVIHAAMLGLMMFAPKQPTQAGCSHWCKPDGLTREAYKKRERAWLKTLPKVTDEDG